MNTLFKMDLKYGLQIEPTNFLKYKTLVGSRFI